MNVTYHSEILTKVQADAFEASVVGKTTDYIIEHEADQIGVDEYFVRVDNIHGVGAFAFQLALDYCTGIPGLVNSSEELLEEIEEEEEVV